MKMSGAEIIIRLLEKAGIEIIPGIPGGSNLPLYHALRQSRIRHILARHEQGAGFMAQGMARATGRTAVCWATSGPGATNLLTAVADAWRDAVPVVFMTGQVPTGMIGTDAFQEVPLKDMASFITKKTYLIHDAGELLSVLPESFALANSGKPGPVMIDIPKDIQLAEFDVEEWPDMPGREYQRSDTAEIALDLSRAAGMINNARRPLLYIGGGAMNSRDYSLIRRLAEAASIPVVSSLMGLGAFPCCHPLFMGMLGMHGHRSARHILEQCDVLIALGARFSDRSTGPAADFCREAKIIHVDVDAREINKIKRCDCGIAGDVGMVLGALLPQIRGGTPSGRGRRLPLIKERFRVETEIADPPGRFIRRIGLLAGPETIVTTDVGQHQMWTAQFYPFSAPRTFLTSGGLGTMGFGLPAAIGAALSCPQKTVLCLTGDGSLLMNIQELAALAEQRLKVKIIVFNNGCLGMVRQQQEFQYYKNYEASVFQQNPDFIQIAEGFGLKTYHCSSPEIPGKELEAFMRENGPALMNVRIDPAHNVGPFIKTLERRGENNQNVWAGRHETLPAGCSRRDLSLTWGRQPDTGR